MLLLAVLAQTRFKDRLCRVQVIRAVQRLAKQIFKHGFGVFGACAGLFGQSLCVFFAVVLVEHRLYLGIVFVRKRFTQRQDDLRGAASVCGGQLCTVQTTI